MFGRKKPEVLVVGAGPVGLFTALVLAKRGVQVRIVDRDERVAAHSYGLALHADSLKMFDDLGLLPELLERAYRVRTIGFYDGADRKSELRISNLSEDFSFLAVVRQDALEGLLEAALKELGMEVLWNHRVPRFREQGGVVTATVDKLSRESVGYAVVHTEWIVSKSRDLEVPFLIGADGHLSSIRRALGIDFGEVGASQSFAVFEFETDADLKHEMRLVLDDNSTNVLWPLPGGHCRWSFQIEDLPPLPDTRAKGRVAVDLGSARFPVLDDEVLHQLVRERAPWFEGTIGDIRWRIAVRFERRMAANFGRGRVWLVGDAGHMTGPVGGQSINVGLREGRELADIIAGILRDGDSGERLDTYNRNRFEEWRQLLEIDKRLAADESTDPWIQKRIGRLLPCLPASGDDLSRLASQLGLRIGD